MGKQDKLQTERQSEQAQTNVDLRDINEQLIISALREQELATILADERVRLEAILDSIGDGVLVVDEQGAPVLTNAAYSRIIGNSDDGIMLEDSTGQRLPFDKAPWRTKAPGETFTVEFSTLHTDGTRQWWEASGRPVGRDLRAHGGVIVIRDVSVHKRLASALQHQVLHDSLTGLPNRSLLYDRLERVLRSADRTLDPLALFLMDLDRFKEINDTLGHLAGDIMLRHVADRLRTIIRSADTVARLSGDEFVVLLPKTDKAGAVEVANRIREKLSMPVMIEEKPMQVAVSIGIVIWEGRGAHAETLMKCADMAMYEAKKTRSGYAFYGPKPSEMEI